MKTIVRVILGIVVVGGLIFGVVMLVSSGARDHARGFVEDVSAGEFSAARARLHPQLQQQLSEADLEQMFEGSEPYVDVSFSSISVSGSQAELSGSATTASECSSAVEFELIDDQIVMFDFTPLCPAP